ncbi:hypothetical protein DEU56DRAFT_249908 [Suillus clintonianus]|uniref:uncharacterized protein n=1 Tax=Suillus clintonianus TaxID=1904413 RepID=UPI001B85C051|nr:uncharacterized protein DEU56DRAFT_249908 [Suillus clintonianus]KAG2110095.1 hypothetical protein DEU56DRAFT_249908 [Suillus clintonianus]
MFFMFGKCRRTSRNLSFWDVLRRLSVAKHGQVSAVEHTATDISKGVGPVDGVRYSLHVKLNGAKNIEEFASTHDEENGRIVMAIRHRTRAFWVVQYHPESVLTRGRGISADLNPVLVGELHAHRIRRQKEFWALRGHPFAHLQTPLVSTRHYPFPRYN